MRPRRRPAPVALDGHQGADLRCAPVDGPAGRADEARLGARQEHGGLGDVPGDALQLQGRHLAADREVRHVVHIGDHWRADVPGRDHIGPQALGAIGEGQVAGELDQARLGRAIADRAIGPEPRDGGDADHCLAGALAQIGQGRAGHQEGAVEVDVDAAPPVGRVGVLKAVALGEDPHIVDQNVDPAEPRGAGRGRGGAGGLVRDVAAERQALAALRLDHPQRVLRAVDVEVEQADLRPLGREQGRDGLARPEILSLRARAGDQRGQADEAVIGLGGARHRSFSLS
jgi:hypothetical protein